MPAQPVVLALDCATDQCSVALGLADGQVLDALETSPRAHNRRLLPMLDGLLAEAGLPRNALQALCVTVGPGSFTGLRIGVGMAQGIAAALDLPVVPMSSLEAMAWRARQVHGWSEMLCALDARQEERYAGHYRLVDARMQALAADAVQPLDTLRARLAAAGPACALVGPGCAALQDSCPAHAADLQVLPLAADLIAPARAALAAGEAVQAAALAPVYLRDASHWVRAGVAPADQPRPAAARPCPPDTAC